VSRDPRQALLDPSFLEDLRYWIEKDPKVARRLASLMEGCLRDPFKGRGKPEPLRGLGPNRWSRRLTEEHRLVYRVTNEVIHFLQGRYHY
jgi:toxin YoeB